MKRSTLILIAGGAVAIVVLAFMFLIKPRLDEAAELHDEAQALREQQSQVEAEIATLQDVRSRSPELEAELAALSSVVPDSPALPAALRQLQMAADEAGATLTSVAPGRPSGAGLAEVPELSLIPLNLQLQGGYFQIVDFLRRLEDPVITARGILVQSVSVNIEDYPTLSVTVQGEMFALLDQPVTEAPEPSPTETTTEDDVDVDVDVDVTEEDAA